MLHVEVVAHFVRNCDNGGPAGPSADVRHGYTRGVTVVTAHGSKPGQTDGAANEVLVAEKLSIVDVVGTFVGKRVRAGAAAERPEAELVEKSVRVHVAVRDRNVCIPRVLSVEYVLANKDDLNWGRVGTRLQWSNMKGGKLVGRLHSAHRLCNKQEAGAYGNDESTHYWS